MKPGSWQRQESPVKWMSGQQNLGSWNEFWQVNMSELGLVCTSTQSQPFHLDLDSVALIGPGGVKVLDDLVIGPPRRVRGATGRRGLKTRHRMQM